MPVRKLAVDCLALYQNRILMYSNNPASVIVIGNHIAGLELLCVVFRHGKPSLIKPYNPPPEIRRAELYEAFDHLVKYLTSRANDIPHRRALIPTVQTEIH